MENISIFKKIKLLRVFEKTIKNNKTELENKFNLRIDRANRLYTVINIPEELIGEAYSLKKSDIDRISENFIRQYGEELARFLDEKGLKELYSYYDIKKVDKYSYLLIFGFRLMKSDKFYSNLYYKVIPVISISVIITFLLLFL
jgi:hypothetical protein